MKSAIRVLRQANRLIKDEVEDSDDLMELVDNFAIVADALLKAYLADEVDRPYSLDKVLRRIATRKMGGKILSFVRRGGLKEHPLWKLGKQVEALLDEIRLAEYAGWELDCEDTVADAEHLRGEAFDAVEAFIGELKDSAA